MELLTFPDKTLEQISSILESRQEFSMTSGTGLGFWIGVTSETWTWIDTGRLISRCKGLN